MTRELLADEGLSIEGDFDELMEAQRERGRAGTQGQRRRPATRPAPARSRARSRREGGSVTTFTGYETTEQPTTVAAAPEPPRQRRRAVGDGGNGGNGSGRYLVKLAESPFYAPGGGQVADVGTIECESGDCRARVEDVFRLGDDQALSVVVERGTLAPGEAGAGPRGPPRQACHRVQPHRHPPAAGGAAPGARHPRAPGRLLRRARTSCASTSATAPPSPTRSCGDVEDLVNEWIYRNDPVRPITTTLDEARKLGAMALFGEKYGDIVRMVQIGEGEYSRELCGGTHVRSTAEIGAFRIISETSSSANVRRIEARQRPAGGRAAARPRRPAGRDRLASCAPARRTRPRR